MSSHQEIRRRYSVADRVPEDLIASMASASTASSASINNITPDSASSSAEMAGLPQPTPTEDSTSTTMPPPAPRDGVSSFRRHTRAKSSISRHVNRLSLTLPIAPPTSDPSRPTPTSASMSSVPQTPIDSAVTSPTDANEFIIAIAAQERRVLELREELYRAESELTLVKKRWAAFSRENPPKRGEPQLSATMRTPGPVPDDDSSSRRSADLDRRKLLLQQTQTATPPQNRRRVLRGGHTRTLSLLSPAKPSAEFPLHEDSEPAAQEAMKLPPIERRTAQLTNPHLAKRASWQPRTQQPTTGMPQLVEDFRLGLRAFVEDIRQITVGDEPINGQMPSAPLAESRNTGNRSQFRDSAENQDTIRANPPLRTKVSTVFEQPNSTTATPTPASKTEDAPRDKPKAGKAKHFSWTPLGFDSLDDNDWANWETQSPSSAKTSRWSGSTMGSSVDDMPAMTEDEPNTTPSKKRSTGIETPLLSPNKLEEILPNMVNRLTPSNIKRTATNLMDEWEKSLMEGNSPRATVQNKENDV